MLLIHFAVTPAESIKQLKCPHCFLPCLKVVEDPLQIKRYRLKVVDISRHLVDGAAEGSYKEHALEERVQVASRTLIDQTIVSVLDGLVST